jgi:hypothetical protein
MGNLFVGIFRRSSRKSNCVAFRSKRRAILNSGNNLISMKMMSRACWQAFIGFQG